jgi:hypothetical protein
LSIDKQIKRYARDNCASFKGSSSCLLEPNGCDGCLYFEDKFLGHKRCGYFERSVIPGDPALELAYWQEIAGEAPAMDVGNCTRCGARYIKGSGAAKYCSGCRVTARRQYESKRMREKRLQEKLKSAQITQMNPVIPRDTAIDKSILGQ